MAVTLEEKDLGKTLALFGVEPHVYQALTNGGVVVTVTPTTIGFTKGKPLSKVTFKAGVLTLAKAGKLGKHSLEHLTHLLDNAVLEVLKQTGIHTKKSSAVVATNVVVGIDMAEGSEVASQVYASISPTLKAAEKTGHHLHKLGEDATALAGVLDLPLNGKAVILANANKMYQPVHGTTTGSRYYVVAMTKGLNIAIRLKGTIMSVRAEGDISKFQSELSSLGLSGSKDYRSMHLEVGTPEMAARTVGSILVGLGIGFKTPYPDVKALWGK